MALLSQEKERSDKLEIDYDTLNQDVAGLIKIERLFNEMKAKQQETNEILSEKSRALAELRPRVQQYESENRKLARDVETLERQLEESVNELVTIKQKISAGDTELLKRYGVLRDTLARTPNGNRATRISQIQLECGELPEELEQHYLNLMHRKIIPSVTDEEALALKRLAAQYLVNKKHLLEILEDYNDVVQENEVRMKVL